jgi:UDP-glucose 4-epimerase
MNILLTGGAGYIGSHTVVMLTEAGYQVVILDSFCNSHRSVLERLAKILGKIVPSVEGDIRDTELVKKSYARL